LSEFFSNKYGALFKKNIIKSPSFASKKKKSRWYGQTAFLGIAVFTSLLVFKLLLLLCNWEIPCQYPKLALPFVQQISFYNVSSAG